MKANTLEYWALYYHVYLFIKNGGTLHQAIKRCGRVDVARYFYKFNLVNPV